MKKRKRVSKSSCFFVLLLVVAVLFFGTRYLVERGKTTLYPQKYNEYVEKYGVEYGVDLPLIYAVIRTESGFDPNAVSEDNAKGLMQITEPTFDWITVHLPVEERAEVHDVLFDPELNIRYGVYLLSYLLKEFEHQEVALAAYHAGRGITNEWLADPDYSEDGETLSKIPYADTAHYVEKVMKNYCYYLKIYEKEE